jgi:peptide subunit release factor 1 (eRF1)
MATVERDGAAAVGTEHVLSAVNRHAVDHLVVAGPFNVPGVICGTCHFLGQSEPACPQCAGATFSVDDLVAEMMEEVLVHGGRTDQVSIPTRLDSFGVGAVLRYVPT